MATTPEPTPQAERAARYAAAIRETDGWVLDGGQHMVAAVIAVADAEQAELRARVADYENRITWHTTCASCARILDSSIRETERAVRAETALAEARQLHAKTCPLAQGAVGAGFTCSLCTALTAA